MARHHKRNYTEYASVLLSCCWSALLADALIDVAVRQPLRDASWNQELDQIEIEVLHLPFKGLLSTSVQLTSGTHLENLDLRLKGWFPCRYDVADKLRMHHWYALHPGCFTAEFDQDLLGGLRHFVVQCHCGEVLMIQG